MTNRKTLLIEAVYGAVDGDARRRAAEFFADPHRDAPEPYTVEFIATDWGRMSIDYMESAREGIRRMDPYLEARTTKIGMRKVALSTM